MKKYPDAFIDLSVRCMGCDAVLWYGDYTPGIIGKVKKLIKKSGWIHHDSQGTLCPECAAKLES